MTDRAFITHVKCIHDAVNGKFEFFIDAVKIDNIEIGAEMLLKLSKPQWTSVNYPPEESGRYWCYVEEVNDLGIGHYQENCSYSVNENRWACKDRVTHWVNLLDPPTKL